MQSQMVRVMPRKSPYDGESLITAVLHHIAKVDFNVAFGPVESSAQLNRLGQSARRKVEIDCAA
jgi:hypothetical protein